MCKYHKSVRNFFIFLLCFQVYSSDRNVIKQILFFSNDFSRKMSHKFDENLHFIAYITMKKNEILTCW